MLNTQFAKIEQTIDELVKTCHGEQINPNYMKEVKNENTYNYIMINNVRHVLRRDALENNCEICSLNKLCEELEDNSNFCLADKIFKIKDVHFESENIDKSNIKEIAKEKSVVYGACFADVSESVANNREQGFYDGFIMCSRFFRK